MEHITLIPNKNVYIAEFFPDDNFAESETLFVDRFQGAGDIYRTLIQFDLRPIMGEAKTIKSATLRLTAYRKDPVVDVTVNAYRLLSSFAEDLVTWATKPVAGIISDGDVCVTSTGSVEIDITDLVQGWYDGSIPNNGLVLKGNETEDGVIGFLSTKYPDSTDWPKLEIQYVAGTQTIYPEETINAGTAPGETSTPRNLDGTASLVTFVIAAAAGNTGTIQVVPQISLDGVNFVDVGTLGPAAGIEAGESIAVVVTLSGEKTRLRLVGSDADQEADVTVVVWQD